jgi:hypothetical protein
MSDYFLLVQWDHGLKELMSDYFLLEQLRSWTKRS